MRDSLVHRGSPNPVSAAFQKLCISNGGGRLAECTYALLRPVAS